MEKHQTVGDGFHSHGVDGFIFIAKRWKQKQKTKHGSVPWAESILAEYNSVSLTTN